MVGIQADREAGYQLPAVVELSQSQMLRKRDKYVALDMLCTYPRIGLARPVVRPSAHTRQTKPRNRSVAQSRTKRHAQLSEASVTDVTTGPPDCATQKTHPAGASICFHPSSPRWLGAVNRIDHTVRPDGFPALHVIDRGGTALGV